METTPLISVVMGAYNAETCIPRAVDSILNQTWSNLEFIILDDGSTDGTSDILRRYARQDSRIRLLQQPNQGLTKSLKQGCEIASGEYLVRQDADDVSLPNRIELQFEKIQSDNKAALCTSWVEDMTSDGTTVQIHRDLRHSIEVDGMSIPLVGIPAHGSVMMRKICYEAAGGYRTQFYFAQDSDLWLRMHLQGSFVSVPAPLYQRVLSTSSISSTRAAAQGKFCHFAQESFRAKLRGKSDSSILSEAEELAQSCRKQRAQPVSRYVQATALLLIAAQLRGKNKATAVRYLREALFICPYHPRVWKALFKTFLSSESTSP
jgi:hypothetical protein